MNLTSSSERTELTESSEFVVGITSGLFKASEFSSPPERVTQSI